MPPLEPLNTSDWSREDLLREARLQTDAIQRLNVWLRLGYSLLAAGFIVGYWGFYGGGGTGFGILGIVLFVVGAVLAVVLKVGTTNAKKNVQAIMAVAGVDITKKQARGQGGKHGEKDAESKGTASSADGPSAADAHSSRKEASH